MPTVSFTRRRKKQLCGDIAVAKESAVPHGMVSISLVSVPTPFFYPHLQCRETFLSPVRFRNHLTFLGWEGVPRKEVIVMLSDNSGRQALGREGSVSTSCLKKEKPMCGWPRHFPTKSSQEALLPFTHSP